VTLLEDRLSTAPAPVEAEPADARGRRPRRTARAWVRLGWRRLTSMRTALQLLFVLSLGAIPGGLLPQRGQEPQAVTAWLRGHPALGPLMDRLSLFDVFAAPWFAAVYLLLFVSLIGCLGPRLRQHVRALRRPPPPVPSRLQRFTAYTSWTTAAAPDEAVAAAGRLLRGWRVRGDDAEDRATAPVVAAVGAVSAVSAVRAVSAERGYLRETGNLVFHCALVLLLAGIGLGSAFGYESNRLLVEGDRFTNTLAYLDAFRPGRLVGPGDLVPWRLGLDRFDATYRDNGTPKSFDARMTFTPAGGSPRPVDVQVNHPLQLGGGAKLYLLNHGYAPTFRLTGPDGSVQTDQAVCRTVAPQTGLASCVASFALTQPGERPHDLAFTATLAPTGVLDPTVGVRSQGPALDNPDLLVTSLQGSLGAPATVDSLDTRLLSPVLDGGSAKVTNLLLRDPRLASVTGLPGGYTLTVPRIDQWASFQVKRDPAKPLVLLAAVLVVAGLLLSLRVRRRRVWVRATAVVGPVAGPGAAAPRTLIEVAGLARSDAPASRAEFDSLVQRLRRALPEVASMSTPSTAAGAP